MEKEQDPNNFRQTEMVSRREASPELTKWQLTGEDLFQEIRMKLEGKRYVYDKNGDVVGVKKVASQVLPDYVIDEMMNILNMYVNKSMQLADFTEKEIHNIVRCLKKDLADYFEVVCLTDTIAMRKIYVANQISNFVWGTLTRAKYGGEKRFLENAEIRRTDVSRANDKGKGGLFSKLSPF